MNDAHLTWSWLNVLTKKRYDALIEVYGNLQAALAACNENLLKQLGCKEPTRHTVLNRRDDFDLAAYKKALTERNLNFVCLADENYPAALKQVPDAPVFLYYQGDLNLLSQPCLGLVGTRAISPYGRRVTEAMVEACVRHQVVTVSGLALGIDTAVARATIAAGGHTVAVLGHGLADIYPPRNRGLAADIVAAGGLIISEYPLDVTPEKHTFPARNRIIAGLSLGTVALEAGAKSGALITLDLALEYNRESFAVPGPIFDPNYAGCNQFISSGRAKLVADPLDALTDIGIVTTNSPQANYQPQNPTEAAVWNTLTTMPQTVTELTEQSGLTTGTINATLTVMELAGVAKSAGSGAWVRG